MGALAALPPLVPIPPYSKDLLLLYYRDKPAPEADPVTILMTGDCSFARGITDTIAENGNNWDYPLAQVSKLLTAADWAVCNHEFAITPTDNYTARKGSLRLRADPPAATALRRAGFDMVSLSNNHTMDFGSEGLRSTLEMLDKAGIKTVGAGANGKAARSPVFTIIKGIKIGWLAYTQVSDPPDEDHQREAESYSRAWLDDEAQMEAEISAAREQCDVLIVQPHWGHEYQEIQHETQQRIGQKMARAGASLVIGHHPHVVQPTAVYRDTLICYSLGNFLFDQADRTGFAVWIRLDKHGVIDVYHLPLTPGVQPKWTHQCDIGDLELITPFSSCNPFANSSRDSKSAG